MIPKRESMRAPRLRETDAIKRADSCAEPGDAVLFVGWKLSRFTGALYWSGLKTPSRCKAVTSEQGVAWLGTYVSVARRVVARSGEPLLLREASVPRASARIGDLTADRSS